MSVKKLFHIKKIHVFNNIDFFLSQIYTLDISNYKTYKYINFEINQ